MQGNKLLPIAGVIALVLVAFVVLRAKDAEPAPQALTTVPKAPAPDADSAADTVRSLTARVAQLTTETTGLRQENAQLLRQRRELKDEVKAELSNELRQSTPDVQTPLDSLSKRLDELAARLPGNTSSSAIAVNPDHDIPVGLGPEVAAAVPGDALVWVEPLHVNSSKTLLAQAGDAADGVAKSATRKAQNFKTQLDGKTDRLLHRRADAAGGDDGNPVLKDATGGLLGGRQTETVKPAYTVPRNATLVGSTAMTAMIGRVPIRGQVEDPFPFKVIVGSENLAANGLRIPNVNGMIFSGDAIGDWTLGCVRGTLRSVTFLFDDGTVRTISSDSSSSETGDAANNQSGNHPTSAASIRVNSGLGWISDRRGIPCVSGNRISNASSYLSGRFLARAVEAAGQGLARSQSTVIAAGATGAVTNAVTGDIGTFTAGQAASGAADELARFLAERQAQQFDVVYVDTGAEVAVHINRELRIDYETRGRRLDYGFSGLRKTSAGSGAHGGLD